MADFDDIKTDCPFPEVADALRPYIKTRQETTYIRRQVQSTLPFTAVDIVNPTDEENDVKIASLAGVRKAYWRALQAHEAAQAKYDALRTELQHIVQDGSKRAEESDGNVKFLAETHIPLLRQHEKLRKLNVIASTVAAINAAGSPMGESFDRVAKREVGELPAPPSNASFAEREAGFNSEYDLMLLKKAVLAVKEQLEGHESAIAQTNGSGETTVDPHAQLRALQKTHNELTLWMETQLSQISNGDSSKADEDAATTSKENDGAAASALDEIEDLYGLYLGARRRLLEVADREPPHSLDVPTPGDLSRRVSESLEIDSRITPSEALLPHLSGLIITKQQEQSLLLQSTHIRRQLASATEQDQAVLARLIDESHLVQPDIRRGSPSGKDWSKAASEAAAATAQSATQRIRAGRASAESASQTLESIRTMPESLEALME